MQSSATVIGSDCVGKAAVSVDDDVMSAAKIGVMSCFCESCWDVGDIAQLGQIKNLHAVIAGFADNKSMILMDFDIPPN